MFRFCLVVLAIVAPLLASSVGCGDPKASAAKKLTGKWELSMDQLKDALSDEMAKRNAGKSGEAMGAAFGAAMMEGMLSQMKMSFDFQQGGKVVFAASMMGRDKSEEGTWEVVSSSGNDVTLKISMAGKEGEPATVTFVDNDTIEIVPPKGQAAAAPPAMAKLIMKRAK